MKILVLYFSNTGNTRKSVSVIQESLRERGHHCEICSIEDHSNIAIDENFDLIGFASPVYHGYPATHMLKFIHSMPSFERHLHVFTLLSCCFRPLDIGVWGAKEHFRDLLESKNALVVRQLRVFGEASHPYIRKIFYGTKTSRYFGKMFGIGCPDNIEKDRIKYFVNDLDILFNNINKSENQNPITYSNVRRWLSKYIVRTFVGAMDRSLLLKIIDKVRCCKCGACIKNCPSQALTWVDEYPAYDRKRCLHCQKCINHCMHGATIYFCTRRINRYTLNKQTMIKIS